MPQEYIIKRKTKNKSFMCPKCKEGELKYLGNAGMFRFKCKECKKYFM